MTRKEELYTILGLVVGILGCIAAFLALPPFQRLFGSSNNTGATSPPVQPTITYISTNVPTSTQFTPTNTFIPSTPTSELPATSTAEPTPLPLYTYTFENGISKDWKKVEDFGYINNNLRGGGFILYNKQPKNYKIRIHMKGVNMAVYVNAKSRTSGYFFICRNDKNICQWYISKDPGFGSAFGQTRNVESVSPSVDLASVLPGNDFYDLEITVNDNNFSAAINGQNIVGFAGSYYAEGSVGVAGGDGDIQSIEVEYLP